MLDKSSKAAAIQSLIDDALDYHRKALSHETRISNRADYALLAISSTLLAMFLRDGN